MGRLTPEERRRVFQAQERARRTTLARLTNAPTTAHEPTTTRPGLRRLLVTATIVTLLGGGWLVYRAMEFHAMEFNPPASLTDTLLPRR